MKAARENWVDDQADLDPEHLIFIDESGLSTKMARLRGWAPKTRHFTSYKHTTDHELLTENLIRVDEVMESPKLAE